MQPRSIADGLYTPSMFVFCHEGCGGGEENEGIHRNSGGYRGIEGPSNWTSMYNRQMRMHILPDTRKYISGLQDTEFQVLSLQRYLVE